MYEFIENLIARLKEHRKKLKIGEGKVPITFEFRGGWIAAHDRIIDIVKEFAEEYKDNVIIDGQYCWQTCGSTEHCKECNRLCNGNIDYYENYDCLLEE